LTRTRLKSPVMTVHQVCTFLQISPATLYRLLQHHQFPAFKLGSDWRFNVEQVEQWARDQERALTAQRKPE
jgi:excisionase family DNA binding protein